MKEKDLISVVVPCYNVEKYVEKTINSILNQTYENLEIIAVEDCSTDNTYEILKELEKKHPNKIKLYKNKKNGGLAYTRNRAIEYAKGNYIGCIDSDDFIDENYFEELMETLKENDADICVTDIVLANEDGKKIGEPQKACDGDINKFNIINNGMAASSCNKLFKKEVIEKYPFLEGKINEDVSAIIPALIYAKKIAYTNKVMYYYVQRNTSIQNSTFSERRYEMFDAIDVCLERIKNVEDFEKYKEVILYHQLIMLYIYVITEQVGYKNRYNLIKKFIKKQKSYKLYNNSLFKEFLKTQRKTLKVYYAILVGLLKYRAAFLINLIITCKKGLAKLYRKTRSFLSKVKRKLKDILRNIIKPSVISQKLTINDLVKASKKQEKMKENDIKVSVVVPNYNYEKFMIQRLYSILNQTEKIYELIILDDCSKDNSRELIDEIVKKIEKYVNVKKIYNEENSGIAFKQWKKGFKLATGDYVWIAEADDCCKNILLENVLKPIRDNKDKKIYISYVDTAFVNAQARIFLPSIKPEIDIRKTGHWDSSYVNNGEEEVINYTFLNCTVANVSSAIIKKDNYDDIFERIIEYRQAGDWLFYANVMKKGYIAYTDKALNFYRVHGENITSKMKKQKHLDEIKRIHNDIKEHFELNGWHDEEMKKRYEFLIKAWNLNEKEN